MADIDALSDILGILWETEKDIPFGEVASFIGFSWDLANHKVGLPDGKKEKYLQAIWEWESKPKLTLDEVQKLYGKLLHTCHIVPAGCAYLTNLEAFMGACHNSPFCLCYPPRRTPSDLSWWKERLTQPNVIRPIPGPLPIVDANAYSDASLETGIGITVRGRWRAWRLLPGWKADGRDIGWAEAVGFWLLILTLTPSAPEALTSKCLGTTEELSRVGGRAEAETNPQTKFSSTFTPLLKRKTSVSTQDTFPAKRTQRMALLEASITTTLSSSQQSSFPQHSDNT
jgi:hypothetical protein